MFFESWDSLMRVVVIGTIGYAALVVLLRLSGNRTLSKMNSFDLVVTFAFGSTLSSILINRNITLAEGLVAIGLLIFLQFIITAASVRSARVARLMKTQPTLLLHNGLFVPQAMRAVRVTTEEIRAAVRQHGLGDLAQASAVVLEADGSLSVISERLRGSLTSLAGVAGASNVQ